MSGRFPRCAAGSCRERAFARMGLEDVSTASIGRMEYIDKMPCPSTYRGTGGRLHQVNSANLKEMGCGR